MGKGDHRMVVDEVNCVRHPAERFASLSPQVTERVPSYSPNASSTSRTVAGIPFMG